MSMRLQMFQNRLPGRKFKAKQVINTAFHGYRDFSFKQQAATRTGGLAGAHMGKHLVLPGYTLDQHLYPAAGFLVSHKARRNDTRIIEYQ